MKGESSLKYVTHPNLTTNIHNFSSNAGGAAQIPQVKAIYVKFHPNSTTNIHNYLGYAGGAAQIPQANTINDKSPTNIHESSGYAGGAAQIPLLQVTLEALPKFHRRTQLITNLSQLRPTPPAAWIHKMPFFVSLLYQ